MTRTLVHAGPYLRIVREAHVLPSGMTSVQEFIDHPGAVVVVPLLDADTLIMLRQYRPPIAAYLYELCAGTLAADEDPRECAGRELREETGYRAGTLEQIGQLYPVAGYSTEKIIVYRATQLQPGSQQLEDDEVIEVIRFTRTQIRDLFRSGQLVDAKTICALAWCDWL